MKKLILISALLFSFNIFADNDADPIEEGGILFKAVSYTHLTLPTTAYV